MYSCGPTVYSYQHIGNMRAYIFADILKKTLEYNNLKVKQVINITDVGHLTSDADTGEDKLEKAAKKEGKSAEEISEFYFTIFKEDLKKLNISLPWKFVKATNHIQDQINLISKLEDKGFTYNTSDGIYFDSTKFKDYGKLARLKIEGLKEGLRVAKAEKKHKTDFALWKFSPKKEKRQQEWPSPWGVGFPGWHIECSAMSMKYLGETFDIHTGGEDHIPVHHTNEIAQSESATGKKFVNYWLHNAFLLNKEGKKISKSTGGFLTISELEKADYLPVHFRYLCLQTHYRKPLKFSLKNLDAVKNAITKIRRKIIEIHTQNHKGPDRTNEYSKKFLKAINDDLNTSAALDIFWKVLDDFDFDPLKKIALLEKFDKVLSLNINSMHKEEIQIPKEIQRLIKKREKARKNKNWAEADILRAMIKEKGFTVEDRADSQKISKTN